MSEESLRNAFKDLAGRLEHETRHDDSTASATPPKSATPPRINDHQLAADIGDKSPVALFIASTRGLCKVPVVGDPSSPQISTSVFLSQVRDAISNDHTMTPSKPSSEMKKVLGKGKDQTQSKVAEEFERLSLFEQDYKKAYRIYEQRFFESTQSFSSNSSISGALLIPGLDTIDWSPLDAEIKKNLEHVCGYSLIYSYWLDEGGLHFALERIADRIENGIVSTTQPLKTLHIDEASPIVDNISSFIVSWQRGELFDVDARRKQYQALYGLPLYSAKAWGAIPSVDPRGSFIVAFHRFLHEASRYYDSQRDRLKVPDLETARSAIGPLLESLQEGNENMRVRRTGQIRGLTEYCKRLLGGSNQNTPVAKAWAEYLTGRPGITKAPDAKPWQVKVDAVASAYGWNRPRAKDYTTLAEASETILVITRLAGAASASDETVAKPFLELVRPHVLRYINAFKVVGGVDLGRNLITSTPAAIMARKIRPLTIPPLKRDWAARAPAGTAA